MHSWYSYKTVGCSLVETVLQEERYCCSCRNVYIQHGSTQCHQIDHLSVLVQTRTQKNKGAKRYRIFFYNLCGFSLFFIPTGPRLGPVRTCLTASTPSNREEDRDVETFIYAQKTVTFCHDYGYTQQTTCTHAPTCSRPHTRTHTLTLN